MNTSQPPNEATHSGQQIRILLLEDSPYDTQRIESQFQKEKVDYLLRRVMTKDEFEVAGD